MATYTFIGDASSHDVDWTDTTAWSGGLVPNNPTAAVVIPTVYYANSTNIYDSTITISTSVDVGSLSISENQLDVHGSLTVGGDVDVEARATFEGTGITIGGTLTVDVGCIAGAGAIATGAVQNYGEIGDSGSISSSGAFTNEAGGTLELLSDGVVSTLTAHTFDNLGSVVVGPGTLTISASAGGFENLSGGVLSGGSYSAGVAPYLGLGLPGAGGQINLAGGGIITTDAAALTLASTGDISSFNNNTSTYEPLHSTLQTIASSGSLVLEDTTYSWNALAIDGQLAVDGGSLTSPGMTVASGGILEGDAEVTGPVTDNGTIGAGLPGAQSAGLDGNAVLEFTGAVTGAGTAVIEPGYYLSYSLGAVHYAPFTLQFDAAASVDVSFSDQYGTLALADPRQFTGSIAPATAAGDQIVLPDVSSSDMTSYTYVSDGDHGTLTMNFSGEPSISLKITGDYDAASFGFTNQQVLSSSPDTLVITIGQAGTARDDFFGKDVSDILLQNASRQVDVGQLSSGSFALTQIDTLGSQWKFVGNGDFLGDGASQIAIENTAGNLGVGQVSGSSIHFTTVDSGLPATTKFLEVGDFLAHGSDQFLIETASGQVEIGSVSGTTTTFTQIDTLGSQWSFVGAGDYLGLGHDQFLIENSVGVGLGQMEGGTLHLETIATGLSAWKVVESGDFLGDGKSDLLLDNASTGQVEIGEVSAGSVTFTVIDTLGSQWSFVGAGDYLGDGKDQILIENTAGNLGLGEVSGGSIHFMTVATGLSEWMFH